MIINILLLVLIVFSLGGIIFIIGRKLFFLAKIDLDKIPEAVAAKIKKELLKKRIERQLSDYKNNLITDLVDFKDSLIKKASRTGPIIGRAADVIRDFIQKSGKRLGVFIFKGVNSVKSCKAGISFLTKLFNRVYPVKCRSAAISLKAKLFNRVDFFKKLVKMVKKRLPR